MCEVPGRISQREQMFLVISKAFQRYLSIIIKLIFFTSSMNSQLFKNAEDLILTIQDDIPTTGG